MIGPNDPPIDPPIFPATQNGDEVQLTVPLTVRLPFTVKFLLIIALLETNSPFASTDCDPPIITPFSIVVC